MGCGASTPDKPDSAPAAAKRVSIEPKADGGKPTTSTEDKAKQGDASPEGDGLDSQNAEGGDAATKAVTQEDDEAKPPPPAAAPPPARQSYGADEVVDFSRGDTDIAAAPRSSPSGVARPASGQRPASRELYGDTPAQPVARGFSEEEDQLADAAVSKPAVAPKAQQAAGFGADEDDDPVAMEGLEAPSGQPTALKNKPSDCFD